MVLLDIAKAYPNRPDPMLWNKPHGIGLPDNIASIIQVAYKNPSATSALTVKHAQASKLGESRRDALYRPGSSKRSKEGPSVHVFMCMDNIAFVALDHPTMTALFEQVSSVPRLQGQHKHLPTATTNTQKFLPTRPTNCYHKDPQMLTTKTRTPTTRTHILLPQIPIMLPQIPTDCYHKYPQSATTNTHPLLPQIPIDRYHTYQQTATTNSWPAPSPPALHSP